MARIRKDMKGKKNWLYKHGLTNSTLFTTWASMRQRCNNPHAADYPRYGGRGIKIDPRWNNFINFHNDMLPLWKEGLTLDRIDVNGNYTKANCRFADRVVQANNRRNTKLFEFAGKSLTLTGWARELGMKRSTLAQRFYVYNWPVERTLTSI